MVQAGCNALKDAFRVIRNEKIFNIYNSSSNGVEEFKLVNSSNYTQSQCAIVIERVFSRLYKYLQFKSTTGEVFQRHVNIDSGYKYLSSDSIRHSDPISPSDSGNTKVYYDDDIGSDNDNTLGYLKYMSKLSEYVHDPAKAGLTDSEKNVLEHFVGILGKTAQDWIT